MATKLEEALPPDVLAEFNRRLADAADADSTAAAVRKIHADMKLEADHGVTLRQAHGYAKSLRRRVKDNAAVVVAENVSDLSRSRLDAWRIRLACAGEIARNLNKQLGAENDGEYQRASRLVLVGRTFEMLTNDEKELSTKELTDLCKLLAAQQDINDPAPSGTPTGNGELSENMRAAIQKIYGITAPSESTDN